MSFLAGFSNLLALWSLMAYTSSMEGWRDLTQILFANRNIIVRHAETKRSSTNMRAQISQYARQQEQQIFVVIGNDPV
jgi:hypothetical protein